MSCIVDWKNVCLVCLQKGDHHCIFQKQEDSDLSIADRIMKCSEFSIKQGMNQPDKICGQCLDDLNVAFKFRQNCQQSNSIIQALLSKDNRELEVSGLRITIPTGIKVRKVPSVVSDTTQDTEDLAEVAIKHEEDDGKLSEENFDSTDYLDNTEILEEEHGDDVNDDGVPFQASFEVIEKLELISELEELKPASEKAKIKAKSPKQPQKRGRGRPKKSHPQVGEADYSIKLSELPSVPPKKKSEAKPQKICEICGNSYKYQHALSSHMRRHRNERPFNCEFCEKAFVSAVELRRHMRVHTGQKPYECQYCERRFSDYGSRIKHERTHTGERPYVCATCGKSFAYAHVLTVHMRTHTGEKKYICPECGRGFTKKAYLDNHLTHHKAGTVIEDSFEASEAAAVIVEQYEEKMQIGEYMVLPVNGRIIKPKEECDDVILPDGYHAIGHVSVP